MNIIKVLSFEEGWRSRPYVDTEGYPTVGYGFKLGPKLAGNKYQREAECHRLYTFEVPRSAGDAWLDVYVDSLLESMLKRTMIGAAMHVCAMPQDFKRHPRTCMLISMAYQMGVDGLADFRNTLMCIVNGDWFNAETGMLKSRWANQTPARAQRHARVMRTGVWLPEYQ